MRSEADARRDAAGQAAPAEPRGERVPPLLRDVGQLLDQGVLVLDGGGGIRWMNDAALRMHGLDRRPPRSVSEHATRFSFRTPGDWMEADPFARALGGEAFREDYQVLPKAGGRAWRCRLGAKPTRDGRGAVSGAVVVMEDVTDAHQHDEQRQALLVRERLARTAAERERDFVHKIFEAAPMPIMVLEGTERRLAFLNRAAADLTGLAPHHGKAHAEMLPRDHAEVEPLLSSVYRQAEAHARVEREYELPSGLLTLQSHYVPLPGPGGQPLGVVWLAIDVTATRRAERALESARRQLGRSERLSALGALVSGVAHELRTPLAYIMNNVFLVRQRLQRPQPPPGDELAPLLDEALSGAERIQRIVGELRKVGESSQHRRAASLDEVVRPAVELFRSTHTGSVRLVADLRPTPSVDADAQQLQQVVLNLLQNAAEAMGQGGEVRISTVATGAWARLVVQDQGPGIPDEARPHVFDEFFTTKEEGTGLGLAIVRRIVDHHRGNVRFETGERGTTFVVELPLKGAASG